MAIITKKLTDSSLKNVTKNNETYQVNINEVSSNVISDGTQITDSVLSNINYKDDKSISFDTTTNAPSSTPGKAIIYATNKHLAGNMSNRGFAGVFNLYGKQLINSISNAMPKIILKQTVKSLVKLGGITSFTSFSDFLLKKWM